MTRNCWPVVVILLFVLVVCLAAPSQGLSYDEFREKILNSQEVVLSSKEKSIERRKQEPQKHLEEENNIVQNYAGRIRRSIVDDAKETVKSTTDSLAWIKKNFRYLLLMAGSIFFLFFSCVAYRRLTRDSENDDDDDVKVVVIGGPKQNSSSAATPPPPTKNRTTKKTSNANKTTPKRSTKPSTKIAKKREKVKSANLKGRGKGKESRRIEDNELNTRDDENHDDSSHSEYKLLTSDDSDVSFSDFVNACASDKDESAISQNGESLFASFFSQKKNPLPQMKLAACACVINEGIPLSTYTSFQQIQESEVDLDVSDSSTSQYLGEIRAHAECLNAKERVTHGNTSYSQYPVLEDLAEVNQALVTSMLERCGQYYPKASTNTNLPITATTS